MNRTMAPRNQKDFFELFVKVEAKTWEECFDKLYEFVVKSRVAEIDACIQAVTEKETACKNRATRRVLNSIQLQLLRQRMDALMPVLNSQQRALAAEVLERPKETAARPVCARPARKNQGRRK